MCAHDFQCGDGYKCVSGACAYADYQEVEEPIMCAKPADCPSGSRCQLGVCHFPMGAACNPTKNDCPGTKKCIRGICQNTTLE